MIDWIRVRELRDEIGAEDFAEVVLMFLQEADDVVARMRNSVVPGGVIPGGGADLHFLRGAALNLGFRAIANLCHEGECRAKEGLPVDLGAIIDRFTTVRATFIAGLESGLDEAADAAAAQRESLTED